MRNLSIFDKVFFILNSILAFLFLVSLIIPYLKPSIFPFLSILSLFSPIIILLNILFLFFWIIKRKKHFLLSFIVLLIGNNSLINFINFSSNSQSFDNSISLLSYNVRLFNIYNWIKDDSIQHKIRNFLTKEDPDIISLQEYQNSEFNLPQYEYKYENLRGESLKYGQAIFSKYPIINSGSLNFSSSSNNAIFSDIKINNDTVRIYNIHLESFSLDKEIRSSDTHNINFLKDLSRTFMIQEKQVELLNNSIYESPYEYIISGDLNNTAYSYIYAELIKNTKDSFKEKGNWFGVTYSYNLIPLRIDFILVNKKFKVRDFKTYQIKFSDHKPIYSEFTY
tara:strand:+ start:13644 stop:14654 length:1011 start_codon:yes stop_codon:yes gene_type:complete